MDSCFRRNGCYLVAVARHVTTPAKAGVYRSLLCRASPRPKDGFLLSQEWLLHGGSCPAYHSPPARMVRQAHHERGGFAHHEQDEPSVAQMARKCLVYPNRTCVPGAMPRDSARPAFISRAYRAGCAERYTFRALSATPLSAGTWSGRPPQRRGRPERECPRVSVCSSSKRIGTPRLRRRTAWHPLAEGWPVP